MFRHIFSRMRDEAGASLAEYALLVALIAVVCFGAVSYFGGSNKGGLGRSTCKIASATGETAPGDCSGP